MVSPKFRVAVTQHEPIWLDLQSTVDKTCKIIAEAGLKEAELVVFPECWIPGYPAWIWSRGLDLGMSSRLVANSLSIDSPQFKQIQNAAAEHEIAVAFGFSERDGDSIYISQALITADGKLAMKRRKMKPTSIEQSVFGSATADCLSKLVPVGNGEVKAKVGQLSCWEHVQPLLKFYTFSQGEQIHVAAWPPLRDFDGGSPGLQSMTNEEGITLGKAYAQESQAFVIHCISAYTKAGIDALGIKGDPLFDSPTNGYSAVISPDSRIITPKDNPHESLLVADLDLSMITMVKQIADTSGHYSRPDLLWLGVDEEVKTVVRVKKT